MARKNCALVFYGLRAAAAVPVGEEYIFRDLRGYWITDLRKYALGNDVIRGVFRIARERKRDSIIGGFMREKVYYIKKIYISMISYSILKISSCQI